MKKYIITAILAFSPLLAIGAPFIVDQGGTGAQTLPSQILQGNGKSAVTGTTSITVGTVTATSGTSTLANLSVSGGVNIGGSFFTNLLTFLTSVCSTITGSSALCDGNDATGLATSSPLSTSNLLVYSSTGAGSAYGVATGTISSGTGISVTAGQSVIGSGLTITNSSPLSGLTASFPFSFSNPTLTWLGLSTTTNTGLSAGNLYIGSGGIMQTSASSSIFGYTPLNPTRTITVSGTSNQITSSAGAQDLSADRTWTLSFPTAIIFPGTVTGPSATFGTSSIGVLNATSSLNIMGTTTGNGASFTYLTLNGGNGTFGNITLTGATATNPIVSQSGTSSFANLNILGLASTSALKVSRGFYQDDMTDCTGTSFLQYTLSSGKFSCGTPTGGGGGGGGAWATNTPNTLTYLTSQWTAVIGMTATTTNSRLEVNGTTTASVLVATSTGSSTISGTLEVGGLFIGSAVRATSSTSTLAGLTISTKDCSSLTNGGKLTTNSSGEVICGNDTSGAGGSGSVSTSSLETKGQVPYWTTSSGYPATLGSVATTSLTLNGPFTGYSALGALIGGSNSTITWSGLATTSQPSSSQLLVSNGGAGVYGVSTSTLTASSPLTGSFTQLGSGGSIGCQTASGSQAGCLASADWTMFNAKVSTSGVASIIAGTTTTALAEGTNLYYLTSRARGDVAGLFPGSTTPIMIIGTSSIGTLNATSSLNIMGTTTGNGASFTYLTLNGGNLTAGAVSGTSITTTASSSISNLSIGTFATATQLSVSRGFFQDGLTDCSNATTNKLYYVLATGKITCGTDQTGGGTSTTSVPWQYIFEQGLVRLSTTTNQVVIGASATSSNALLTVGSPTQTATSTVYGTSTANSFMADDGYSSRPAFRFTNSQNTGFYLSSAGIIDVSGAGFLAVRIDGNTGQLRGGSNGTGLFRANIASGVTTPTFTFAGDTDNGVYQAGTDKLGFTTTGVQRGLFDDFGRFGVGTSSPWARLSISGSSTLNTDFAFAVSDIASTTLFSIANNGSTTAQKLTITDFASTTQLSVARGFFQDGLGDCSGEANTVSYTLATGKFGCLADAGGAGGSPAGSNGEIQYNVGGAFGSNSSFEWDYSSTPQIPKLGIGSTTPWATVSIEGTSTDYYINPTFAVASGTTPFAFFTGTTTTQFVNRIKAILGFGTTTDKYGQSLTNNVTIAGKVNLVDYACDASNFEFGVTLSADTYSANTIQGSLPCGLSFDEITDADLFPVMGESATSGLPTLLITAGTTAGGGNIDAGAIRTMHKQFTGSTSPTMAGYFSVYNGTGGATTTAGTFYQFGFSSQDKDDTSAPNGYTMYPTQGFVGLVASGTSNNWIAVTASNGSITTTDTGVATTTSNNIAEQVGRYMEVTWDSIGGVATFRLNATTTIVHRTNVPTRRMDIVVSAGASAGGGTLNQSVLNRPYAVFSGLKWMSGKPW